MVILRVTNVPVGRGDGDGRWVRDISVVTNVPIGRSWARRFLLQVVKEREFKRASSGSAMYRLEGRGRGAPSAGAEGGATLGQLRGHQCTGWYFIAELERQV